MPENDQSWMGLRPRARGCDCHLCRPEASYDKQDRRVIDTVRRHGWQVLTVGAGCEHPEHVEHEHDEDSSGPVFAYTIGLGHRVGHPELLMSGLDHHLMHRCLNGIAQRVMNGLRLAPGDSLEDVLAGVPVAVEQVAERALGETVPWAGWFHRRKPEALAIVWPDGQGVFGWQPGAPDLLDELQPPEWRVPIEHTGGLAADPAWVFPVPADHRAFSCTHVVDDGQAVLYVARQSDEARVEDWTIHCGADAHDLQDTRVVHLAHLVRSAPALRRISDLGLDEEAWRDDADAPWQRARLT
ncbi:MAG: DUF4262 domain-containing protein [Nocardioides sp.]